MDISFGSRFYSCATSLVNFFLNDLVVQDLVAHNKIVSCGRGLRGTTITSCQDSVLKGLQIPHKTFPMNTFKTLNITGRVLIKNIVTVNVFRAG